jgi:hypothetical protein
MQQFNRKWAQNRSGHNGGEENSDSVSDRTAVDQLMASHFNELSQFYRNITYISLILAELWPG